VAGTGKGVTKRQQAFGDYVRMYRIEAGLTQEALAYEAGLNRTYVASLEAGARNPSLETIVRLALALGVDAADLVRGLQKKRGRVA
jgi:transcriptional regulator with XRE-family HTH domain